uniref:NADH dehydrogenase subunit 6 n=1 Tax=Parapolybia nodosa TaxID=2592910 RepID=A0A514CQR9_9HYME|nr:NADH dehydrogenase subunit 6 [Parapolybia nodosa]
MNQTILFNLIYSFILISILWFIIFNKLPTTLLMSLLIFYTTITSILMANLTSKTTYSFIMFLMIIGGLMILFMMFLSLISKEYKMNKFNPNNLMIMTIIILLMTPPMIEYLNMQSFSEIKLMTLKNSHYFMNINTLINYPNNMYLILLMMFLLIILFLVTKLCLINNKPLRKFNN